MRPFAISPPWTSTPKRHVQHRLMKEDRKTVVAETPGNHRAERRGKVDVVVRMFMARKRSSKAYPWRATMTMGALTRKTRTRDHEVGLR